MDVMSGRKGRPFLVSGEERLIENVVTRFGLHRFHVERYALDPVYDNWLHLIPLEAEVMGIWKFEDSQHVHHLVVAWKDVKAIVDESELNESSESDWTDH